MKGAAAPVNSGGEVGFKAPVPVGLKVARVVPEAGLEIG